MIGKKAGLVTLIASLVCITGGAQINMNLIGQLDYQALHGSDISDVWGYTDEFGNEYALVGVNDGGVSVVDLSIPTNPTEIFFYPGPSSIWRDLKVWGDHAYITTEGGGGLVIIDLSPLPGSTALNAISWQGTGWQSAHNLYIDENGICYIFGANRDNGGVIFLDLTALDPMNPVEIGSFEQWYFHDGMARGDTLYGGHISDGLFSVLDVSDKQNVQILGTYNTNRGNSVHNIWVSDDGDYVFTTDEVSGGLVGSYDISDPTDIKEIDLTVSDPGSGTIPHNLHVLGDFILTSYYRYGVTVHDISRPHNVIETGWYDTSPALSGNGFNGAWGAYPYFPSGTALGTDIENGLFVFDVNYVNACWLEGEVTDAVTTSPIDGATVEILSIGVTEDSESDGTYATGYYNSGTYDVQVSKPGYAPQTISGVQLNNGQVTIVDVQLQPLVSFSLGGAVDEVVTGNDVPFATVTLENNDFNFSVVADSQGQFTLNGVFDGTYDITVGAWGWETICLSNVVVNSATPSLMYSLNPGYMDDFAVDLGWNTASFGASSGFWERDDPIGTIFGGGLSNPDSDVGGDCLGKAYVTGNGGSGAGVDDIDGGTVILTSPSMDLTGYLAPEISYYRWFFNAGGSNTPNDAMIVSISNGADTVAMETITATTAGNQSWVPKTFTVTDFVSITNNMYLVVEAFDQSPGHLVEGGLDQFVVMDGPTGVGQLEESAGIGIYPNPTMDDFFIDLSQLQVSRLDIRDAQGRLVWSVTPLSDRIQGPELPAGYYQVIATSDDGLMVERVIVQ